MYESKTQHMIKIHFTLMSKLYVSPCNSGVRYIPDEDPSPSLDGVLDRLPMVTLFQLRLSYRRDNTTRMQADKVIIVLRAKFWVLLFSLSSPRETLAQHSPRTPPPLSHPSTIHHRHRILCNVVHAALSSSKPMSAHGNDKIRFLLQCCEKKTTVSKSLGSA